MQNELNPEVKKYLDAGFSFMPIKRDGSKAPLQSWKWLEKARPTYQQCMRWGFSKSNTKPYGLAIVGGHISGNLEIIDFDKMDAFESFMDDIAGKKIEDVVLTLPFVKTPRGVHIYMRLPENASVPGNDPTIARRAFQEVNTSTGEVRETVKAIIESRGEGGYVLSPFCPPDCHPLGLIYQVISGDIFNTPVISVSAWKAIRRNCANLNEVAPDPIVCRPKPNTEFRTAEGHFSSVDDYNIRGDFEYELELAGWKRVGIDGAMQRWCRPGKNRGISASSGPYDGRRHFYCWSSSAPPFSANHGYTPFGVYSILRHGNDGKSAAKSLKDDGFGSQTVRLRGII